MTELQQLKPYATDVQAKYIDAVAKHGSARKAACELGVHHAAVSRSLAACRKKAATMGYAPAYDLTHPVAPGQTLKGASTLYDAEGNIVQQWVKSRADLDKLQEIMAEVAAALSENIKRAKPTKPPKTTSHDLLNLYPITDYHVGMYAWGEETGADWDLDIAEDLLTNWFTRAIASSPDASVGVLAQMGDFLHTDGTEALTPHGKNILDADSRRGKLIRVAVRVLRRVTAQLLAKHDQVHVIMAEGNHDEDSARWLTTMWENLYEDEPRLTVDTSPRPYYAYEFGNTLLAVHHGHKRSPKNVDQVIAGLFREEFGRTKYAYAHLGHKHEAELRESPLMIVEQHRTLAAPDAYAARGGWISGRGASVITYSRQHGEVGRVTISPEMCSA